MVSAIPRKKRGLLSNRSIGRIGADIGTRMMKFAQCRRAFGAWKVSAVQVLPVVSRQLADVAGLTGGVVSQSLAGVSLRSSGFKGTSAVAALSNAVVSPTLLELPHGDDDDLANMVREECDVNQSSSVDFWKTKPIQNGNNDLAHVNAVILHKEHAFSCADSLRQAGLHCDSISVQSAALARAVQMIESSDRPIAAIDWGATAPVLSICRNGQAEFSRVLRHCGLGSAVKAVSADLKINELEVAQLLVAYGVEAARRSNGTIERRLHTVLSDHTAKFLQEVSRTLEFIKQNQPQLNPEWLCLFGGGATIAGIATHLTHKLRCETRCWELEPGQLDQSLRSLKFQSLFGVAVGLSTMEVDI